MGGWPRHSAGRTSVVLVDATLYVSAVDGSPIGIAVPLSVLPIVGAVVLWIIAARTATGAIGPNRWVGLRTRATMASPEAWVAGNGAARVAIQTAAVIIGVTGVAVGVLAWTTDLLPLILLVGIALMFGAVVRACPRLHSWQSRRAEREFRFAAEREVVQTLMFGPAGKTG